MVNNITSHEMIYIKLSRRIILMRHNALVLIVAVDVGMDKNGYTRMDMDEEGTK